MKFHENVAWVTRREVVLNLIVALFVSLLLYVANQLFAHSTLYILSVILLVLGMNFVVYVSRKIGLVSLYMFLVSILTNTLPEIGVVGFPKIVVLFVAALIFEGIFLFLKIHIHNIPLDIVVGTSIAMASIPFTTALFISLNVATLSIALFNFMLLSLAVGLAASTVMFLIWHNIEKTKTVIKLESYLQSLTRKL